MNNVRRRLSAAGSLVAFLCLYACGGGEAASDQPPLACGVQFCDSGTLQISDISPHISVERYGSSGISGIVTFTKGADSSITVLLGRNEKIAMSIDGGPEIPAGDADNGLGRRFSLGGPSSSDQPVVRVIFTRDGSRHISEVTLPPLLRVLQPIEHAPAVIDPGVPLPVRLNLASTEASAFGSGGCRRVDESAFQAEEVDLKGVSDTTAPGNYLLDPSRVSNALNAASVAANNGIAGTSKVTSCLLSVKWRVRAIGKIAPTMNSHGTIVGDSVDSHLMSYRKD